MSQSFIQLDGMVFYAFHGVSSQERKVGNTFIVSVSIAVDLFKAADTDNLQDTINYSTIFELVKEEMLISSNLLEHVAGRILMRIKGNFSQVGEIEVKVSKINPPVGGDMKSATVVLKN